MSSTVLLSKGAGQIYIMTVMAEAAVADDSVPPSHFGQSRERTISKRQKPSEKTRLKIFPIFVKPSIAM